MAGGTEYQGEELGYQARSSAQVRQSEPAQRTEYPQLQLATIETSAPQSETPDILPDLDIDTLIKSVGD
jgi:hypothetical protein